MTLDPRRRRTGLLAIAAVLTALALTGCSATKSSSPTSDNAAAGAPGAAAGAAGNGGGVVPQAQGDQKQPGSPQAPAQIEPAARSLTFTGSVTVRVDDVVKAADRATEIAATAGGLVGSDQRSIDADRSTAQLTLRVPADKFTSTLAELSKLGVEESRAVQTEDVTEAIIDLDARLATQKASVERVRALLAKAQSIGEVVSIESEVTRREADLASLQQRKDHLAGLIALSTITLNLHGPAVAKPTTTTNETGFVAGLKAGWNGFLASVKIVLTVAGWLLPWAIAIGVPVWAIVWLSRRRHRASRSARS
jgi:hypothetical protein